MRIVAFADTHTKHHDLKLPEGDVLIFAGEGEFRHVMDGIKFNDWLSGLKYECMIAIAGNHDFYGERYPGEVKNYLTKAVYLKDEPHVLPNGMTIWGSPMTRTFFHWAFMESEENLDRYHWSKIPQNTDILLTHGPAFGHQDTTHPGGDNLGSKTLAKTIDRLKIPYVVCGHIHQPEMREIANEHGKIMYLNSGDWIENLTALEYTDGKWEIYRFDEVEMLNMSVHEQEEELNNNQLFDNLVEEFNLLKQ